MNVALLGAGLIGGSVALRLEREPGYSVTIYDPDPETCRSIAERGQTISISASPEEAVRNADLVFVCAPVSAIAPVVLAAAPHAPESCVFTDVGSTKRKLVEEVEASLGGGRQFLGGHPMAGSEEAGAVAARPDLFEGAMWLLTPTDRSQGAAYERVHEAVQALGARSVALDAATHDSLMASVSHVPQLMASSLMLAAIEATSDQPGLLALAGRGFRDMTRLAASNPRIWLDVCEQNAADIAHGLSKMAGHLTNLSAIISEGNAEDLERVLSSARLARRSMRDKPITGDLHELVVPIPDRPGVLALVTTTIGNLGVNIEDIEIVHGVDGARGVLTLIIAGGTNAERAVSALANQGLVAEYRPR